MPLVDLVHAFKKALPSWDPAKHPRDRDGQFIEVGDLVRAYESKDALEPDVVGRVHASYFAPDGRMFIGVEAYGYVRWYRPKQLEHVKVKATLNGGKEKLPELPLPAVDEKFDEVFWENGDTLKKLGTEVEDALYNEAVGDLTLKKSDLDDEFLEMAGLKGDSPVPSTVPQEGEVKIPAGKTPDDMLRLIFKSYQNKGLASGVAEWNQFNADFQDMLDDPEFKSATNKLSKIMTKAKLGGKQRKRYNSILAQKYGGHQAASFTPVVEDAVDGGEPGEPAWDQDAYVNATEFYQDLMMNGEDAAVIQASKDDSLSPEAKQAAGDVWAAAEANTEVDPEDLAINNGAQYDDELVTVQEATQDPGYPIPAPPDDLADWEKELLENVSGPILDALDNPGPDDFGELPAPEILPESLSMHLDQYREMYKVDPQAVLAVANGSAPAGTFNKHEIASAKQVLAEHYWSDQDMPTEFATAIKLDAVSNAELNAVGAWTHDESPAQYLPGAADISPDGTIVTPADQTPEHESQEMPVFPYAAWDVVVDTNDDDWFQIGADPEKVKYWTDHLHNAPYGAHAVIKLASGQSLIDDGLADKDASLAAKQTLLYWYATGNSGIGKPELLMAGINVVGPDPVSGAPALDESLPYDDSIVDPDMVKLFSKSLDGGMFEGVEKVVQEGPGGPTNWDPTQVESAKAALYEYGGASAIPAANPIPPAPAAPDEIDPVWFGVADDMATNSVLYQHPQGSILISYPSSGTVVKYNANGKKVATSATYQKLVNGGHGQWSIVGTGPDALINLKENQLAPGAPKPAAAPTPTPTPTPEPAPAIDKSQDEVISLLGTSFANKYGKDTSITYPGGVSGFKLDLQSVLDDADYESARKKLAKLMTVAKLGGKQRKRYNDALAAKFGSGPVVAPTGKGKGFSGPDTWAPFVPSNSVSAMGPTPAGVVGPTKGNALVNPPTATPQGAKATIQEQLSARMKGKVKFEQLTAAILESKFDYGSQFTELAKQAQKYKAGGIAPGYVLLKNTHGMWSVHYAGSSPGGKEKIANPTSADWERAMLETVANSLIAQWAGTSNDHNARSLALQEAAVEEFGLKDTYEWPAGLSLKNDTKWELNKHRELYRTFLREMYNNTQDWAKKNGVKSVRLRRGSGTYVGAVGSKANAKLRPMSSFSTNYGTAQQFGSHRIEAYVPIEWVIGNAATGYGCQNEYEWVVLGGTHKVKVIQ